MDNNTNPVPEPIAPSAPEPPTDPVPAPVPSQPQPDVIDPNGANVQMPASSATAPAVIEAPKKNKMTLRLIAPIAAIVLIIGGASAAALVASGTFASPEEKINKAMAGLFNDTEAKFTGVLESGEDSFSLDIAGGYNLDDKQFELALNADIQGLEIGGEARVVDDSAYLLVNELGALELLIGGDSGIDGQWFSLDNDAISENGLAEDDDVSCVTNALSSYSKEDRQVLGDGYKEHPIFKVEEMGKEDGLTKYGLTPNTDEEQEAFYKYIEQNMPLAKQLMECSAGEDAGTEDIEGAVGGITGEENVLLFAYLKGTSLKKLELKVDQDEDLTLTMDFDFGAKVSVDKPEDVKPISELFNSDFAEGLLGGLLGGSSSQFGGSSNFESTQERARDTERKTDINAIFAQLEGFYNDNGYYPSVLRAPDFPGLDQQALVAPNGSQIASSPTDASASNFGGSFVNGEEYLYGPYGCESAGGRCSKFILVAQLEAEDEIYRVESLN